MTKKGEMIRDYIASRDLDRGGVGWLVMGAFIAADGHAYENRHYHCCPKDCNREDHSTIDHGKVVDID